MKFHGDKGAGEVPRVNAGERKVKTEIYLLEKQIKSSEFSEE